MIKFRAVKKLHSGSKVGLFSPSEPFTSERQIRATTSLELLQQNYSTVFADNAFEESYYQAGTREQRAADIHQLLADRTIDALLATWGGKNCSQLIDLLPYELFAERRIPVLGFSDTGVILNAISAKSHIVTFYGPNIAGKLIESAHWDLSALRGAASQPFGETARESWTTVRAGTASGNLVGGNLSTFAIGIGGSDILDQFKDPIFFWESASEPPQIIDQFLTGLENSGFLRRIRGMIVGNVQYEEVERKARPLLDLLLEYSERLDIPVIKIDTFGHLKTENPIIPIGARVRIDTHAQDITLLEQIVD